MGYDERITELLDRQEIFDCLLRYTRGIDRIDEELVRSAFHDDGIDCHGAVSGSSQQFLDWWLPLQGSRQATQHFITNHTVKLDGDVAHTETYYIAIIKQTASKEAELFAGRYVDRLERRGGEWKIAVRVVLPEWGASLDASQMEKVFEHKHTGSRDRRDPSYERPLRPRPSLGTGA